VGGSAQKRSRDIVSNACDRLIADSNPTARSSKDSETPLALGLAWAAAGCSAQTHPIRPRGRTGLSLHCSSPGPRRSTELPMRGDCVGSLALRLARLGQRRNSELNECACIQRRENAARGESGVKVTYEVEPDSCLGHPPFLAEPQDPCRTDSESRAWP
jgi:hypothetical protein